jgi:hypothetical protein
MRGRWSRRAL